MVTHVSCSPATSSARIWHTFVLTARHGNGFPAYADVYVSNPTYMGWIYKGNYPQEGACSRAMIR